MARPVKGRQVDRLPDYARFCAAGRELEGTPDRDDRGGV